MKRYLALLVVVLAGGALLSAVARAPRRAPATAVAPSSPERRVTLELSIERGRLEPGTSQAPKDARVELRVTNRGGDSARLTLAGYEEVAISVAPHSMAAATFLADRPGDDFAWKLDGVPAGRFRVLGSHLVEGHR